MPLITKKSFFWSPFGVITCGTKRSLTLILTVSDAEQPSEVTSHKNKLSPTDKPETDAKVELMPSMLPEPDIKDHTPVSEEDNAASILELKV